MQRDIETRKSKGFAGFLLSSTIQLNSLKFTKISDTTSDITALKTLGYDSDVMTAHGFRTTASTLLNEQGWSADAIERQLAHSPRDQVRAAYNRAQYLEERRRMMQSWSDYLDKLKSGAEILPFKNAITPNS